MAVWEPLAKLMLSDVDMEHGEVPPPFLLAADKKNVKHMDVMEGFADANPGSVGTIFATFGVVTFSLVFAGLCYWTYTKDVFLFITVIGAAMTIYSIQYLLMLTTVKAALKPSVYRFYFGSTIFLMILGIGVTIFFFMKYYNNSSSSSSSSSPSDNEYDADSDSMPEPYEPAQKPYEPTPKPDERDEPDERGGEYDDEPVQPQPQPQKPYSVGRY